MTSESVFHLLPRLSSYRYRMAVGRSTHVIMKSDTVCAPVVSSFFVKMPQRPSDAVAGSSKTGSGGQTLRPLNAPAQKDPETEEELAYRRELQLPCLLNIAACRCVLVLVLVLVHVLVLVCVYVCVQIREREEKRESEEKQRACSCACACRMLFSYAS